MRGAIRRLPTGEQGVPNPRGSHWATSLMASSRFPAWVLIPHLFFSSPGVRSLRRAGPKKVETLAFSHFWSIFTPSKKWLEFYLQKIDQQMQKIMDLGVPKPSSNGPKILPKSRSPKSDDFLPKLFKKWKFLKTLTLDFVAMASVF